MELTADRARPMQWAIKRPVPFWRGPRTRRERRRLRVWVKMHGPVISKPMRAEMVRMSKDMGGTPDYWEALHRMALGKDWKP